MLNSKLKDECCVMLTDITLLQDATNGMSQSHRGLLLAHIQSNMSDKQIVQSLKDQVKWCLNINKIIKQLLRKAEGEIAIHEALEE